MGHAFPQRHHQCDSLKVSLLASQVHTHRHKSPRVAVSLADALIECSSEPLHGVAP